MSVFKRFNGEKITSKHPNWQKGTWYCWTRVNGKPVHRSLNARTKEQAEKEEKQLVDRILNGESEERGFSDFVDDVYVRYIEGLKSKDTQEIFIPVLKAFFKNELIHKIKTQRCRDFRTKRLKTPTKDGTIRENSSVNRERAALSKIFELAIEEGCAKANPVSKIKKLPENEPRHRLLSPTQWKALWEQLQSDPYVRDFVILAMNFPLRKTQILSIRSKNIDIENRTLWAVGSKRRPPRPLYINDLALDALLRLMSDNGDELFPVKRFEKRWRKILELAKINPEGKGNRKENFHLHDLRTHLGSSMILNKVSPRVVQQVFDHSNMTTSSIYMAVEFEQQKEALRGVAATNPATNFFDETAKTQ